MVARQHRFATRYIVDIAARCSNNAWQGRGGVEYSAGVAGGGSASASLRYPAIDVLRGLALISMVSTHFDDLQQATFVGRILHSARWIDGAFYFVALSGVVTGLVHRRVVERSGRTRASSAVCDPDSLSACQAVGAFLKNWRRVVAVVEGVASRRAAGPATA